MAEREIILPGGGFARIRPLTGADLVRLNRDRDKDPNLDFGFLLLSYAAEIDGKPVTYAELIDMDLRDVIALTKEIDARIGGPVT